MLAITYRSLFERLNGTGEAHACSDRWVTVPNAITVAGILGILAYVWLFLTESCLWAIPLIHLGVLLSDTIDGIVADRLNQHTRIGKYLDQARDRLHGAALCANVVYVSLGFATLFPVGIAFAAEVWIGILAVVGLMRNAHAVDKARAGIYGIAGFVILLQFYWTGWEFVSLTLLIWLMTAGSAATALYCTKAAWRT